MNRVKRNTTLSALPTVGQCEAINASVCRRVLNMGQLNGNRVQHVNNRSRRGYLEGLPYNEKK
jgi:hypothetical protein